MRGCEGARCDGDGACEGVPRTVAPLRGAGVRNGGWLLDRLGTPLGEEHRGNRHRDGMDLTLPATMKLPAPQSNSHRLSKADQHACNLPARSEGKVRANMVPVVRILPAEQERRDFVRKFARRWFSAVAGQYRSLPGES